MKPADLYLTSRHIFGFLIPGMVWSLALRYFLHAFGVRAASILPDCFPLSKFGVVAAVFLFCSYLAGMLLQALSFGSAEFVEQRWLRNYFVRKRDSGCTSLGELELAAHKLLEQNYPLVAAHLPKPADDRFRMATFLACKKTILARSAELSRSFWNQKMT